MICFIKNEIHRVFKSKLFWITLSLGGIIAISQYFTCVLPMVQYLDEYSNNFFGTICPHTWYEKWLGGELVSSQSYTFFMILPILCVLPHGMSLASDKASGYTCNMFIRGKKLDYYIAKYIVTFLSGGIVILLPLLLNLFMAVSTLPSIAPDPATGTSMITDSCMWANFYYSHPNLYTIIYLIIIFAFSGAIAVLGLTIGSVLQSAFFSVAMPFIIYLFVYVISFMFNVLQISPFAFLSPAQRAENISFGVILIEWLLLFFGVGIVYALQIHRDESLK